MHIVIVDEYWWMKNNHHHMDDLLDGMLGIILPLKKSFDSVVSTEIKYIPIHLGAKSR